MDLDGYESTIVCGGNKCVRTETQEQNGPTISDPTLAERNAAEKRKPKEGNQPGENWNRTSYAITKESGTLETDVQTDVEADYQRNFRNPATRSANAGKEFAKRGGQVLEVFAPETDPKWALAGVAGPVAGKAIKHGIRAIKGAGKSLRSGTKAERAAIAEGGAAKEAEQKAVQRGAHAEAGLPGYGPQVPPWKGRADYSHIQSPANVNASTKPTPRQAKEMKIANRGQNDGFLRDDATGEIMRDSAKSMRGVKPPRNEAQVDHVRPVNAGGTRDQSNLELRTRENNRTKSDTWPGELLNE